ncbi:hypothetical protein N665_0137s0055 [Sinapis alba]|nr:hypothetical protein N665_0137s0055 [Sinapis alba]
MTVGQPPLNVNLVLDVGGSALFFQCGDLGYNSTTYAPIFCWSRDCPEPKDVCTTTCYGPFGPTCRNDTCISSEVEGLPSGANGVLGLSNSSTSFVNGLVSSYKIPFKVALCLPSKDYSGNAYIGGGPYLLPPNRKDVTGLLVSTPMMWAHEHVTSYTIDVTSIEVNGKRVASKNNKGPWEPALIGKSIPYSRLDSSIYDPLVKAFAEKAQKVNAVLPFTDCFSYKSFGGKSLLEKEVPVISLVLGGGAKWDIYGPNSLVKVNKNVLCLAFERVGNWVYPIEIGSYQMEDNLVEFDLEASKFSFTSSLLRHNISCSPQ